MVNTEPRGEMYRCPGSIYNIPGVTVNGSGFSKYVDKKTTYAEYVEWMKKEEAKRESEKVKYNARTD